MTSVIFTQNFVQVCCSIIDFQKKANSNATLRAVTFCSAIILELDTNSLLFKHFFFRYLEQNKEEVRAKRDKLTRLRLELSKLESDLHK